MLANKKTIALREVQEVLRSTFAYVTAAQSTWDTYAQTFTSWLDYAGLALYEADRATLTQYDPGSQVRSRRTFRYFRRSGAYLPEIQYKPIEKAMTAIAYAIKHRTGQVDLSGMKKSTWQKALRAAEAVGFVAVDDQMIRANDKGLLFADEPQQRSRLFLEGARNVEAFTLFEGQHPADELSRMSLSEMAVKLAAKFGPTASPGTTKGWAKILRNWLKHAGVIEMTRGHV
jgi:hypothetical protein